MARSIGGDSPSTLGTTPTQYLMEQQFETSQPRPDGLQSVTDPLIPDRVLPRKLDAFDPEVYNLAPGSHLHALLDTLLGPAGTGGLRRQALTARLANGALSGTNFFDIDTFWGSVFGTSRIDEESYRSITDIPDDFDPVTATADLGTWDAVNAADGSYRSRLMRIARGFALGATALGIRTVAEAVLNCPVQVHESWRTADLLPNTFDADSLNPYTWDEIETLYPTWGDISGHLWSDLVGDVRIIGQAPASNRGEIILQPSVPVTQAQRRQALRVLDSLKPAGTFITIGDAVSSPYRQITPRSVSTDSEDWRVISAVAANSNAVIGTNPYFATKQNEITRPVDSIHDGENLVLNGLINAVTAYPLLDGVIQQFVAAYDVVIHDDGSTQAYLPSAAVASAITIGANRAVSDGILTSFPLSSASTSTVPVLASDSGTLADLSAVPSIEQSTPVDYWATPPRYQDTEYDDVLEIHFGTPQTFNTISFEISRYPVRVLWQWQDLNYQWHNILDADTQRNISTDIAQSSPLVIPNTSNGNPQHDQSDHWLSVSRIALPENTNAVRLILRRNTSFGTPPRSVNGQFLPYSLAIRNLQISYSITQLQAIPNTAKADRLRTRPFASSTDMFGSTVDHSLYVSSADLAIDPSPELVWQCEPQPSPQAVVNFFADLRDASGNGRFLDSIYLDPVNVGAHLTVYYSEQSFIGDFTGVAQQLYPPAVTMVSGAYRDFETGLDLSAAGARVDVDNGAVGLDESQDWWLGIQFDAPFTVASGAGPRTVFATSQISLIITSNGLRVQTSWGAYIETVIDFYAGYPITATVSIVDSIITLDVVSHDQHETSQIFLTTPFVVDLDDMLHVGGAPGSDGLGNIITQLVIKQETIGLDNNFLVDPASYTDIAPYQGTQTGADRNALLRLDYANPQLKTPDESGLFASVVQRYESIEWIPIPEDYQVHRGWIELPRTRATMMKLEFTNLPVRPREVYQPVSRTVRYFPPAVLNRFAAELPTSDRSDLASTVSEIFLDRPTTAISNVDKGYTATEVLVTDSEDISERLNRQTPNQWLYQGWHTSDRAPRWTNTERHQYRIETVISTSKISYGFGIRSLQFALRDFNVPQDVVRYDELLDTVDYTDQNWIYNESDLTLNSGSAVHATAQSPAYASVSDLAGLQFATIQSDPKQLLQDPDFRDPDLTNWTILGDVRRPQSDGIVQQLSGVGSSLFMDRGGLNGTWYDVESRYLYWADFEGDPTTPDDNVIWGLLESNPIESFALGGIQTALPIDQPFGGRLYAAARVFAQQTLTQPLSLRIVDSVTGEVLAEKQQTPQRNQVTEWYVGYDVGAGGDQRVTTWNDITHENDPAPVPRTDMFARSDADLLGQMTVGGAWDDGQDTMHLRSGVARALQAGDASTFTPDTPWGTFTATVGTQGTGGPAWRPWVDLGTHWLAQDGSLRDLATDEIIAVAGYTPADNDIVSVTHLLTVELDPSFVPNVVPALHPYAMQFVVNGAVKLTRCSSSAPVTRRGLAGVPGQTFSAIVWTPRNEEIPLKVISQMPFLGTNTGQSDSASQTSSYSIDGIIWTKTNGVVYDHDVTTGRVNASLTAAALNGIDYVTFNADQDYGGMRFRLTTAHNELRPIAILDITNTRQTQLFSDGSIKRTDGVTVATGTALDMTKSVEVLYLRAISLPSTFRTARGIINDNDQVIVIMQGETVMTVAHGSNLWTYTSRGVVLSLNDVLNGLSWSVSGNSLVTDTTFISWNSVTRNETALWSELETIQSDNLHPVHVQLVQNGTTDDSWYVDNISLFIDPIVWEFSRDDGETWVPGNEVRNDPNGVVTFPLVRDPYVVDRAPRNQLRWRVTGWYGDTWISHLAVRPWYVNSIRGATNTSEAVTAGSQLAPTDHLPSITDDQDYRLWNRPIPRWWWFRFKDISVDAVVDQVLVGDLVESE